MSDVKTHCKHGHELNEANTLVRGTRRICRACNKARAQKHLAAKKSGTA